MTAAGDEVVRQRVFPFLVGCPRSGTTLLRAMLDCHSQLAIPDESHFIPRMTRHRERFERSSGFDSSAFVDALLADGRFRAWQLTAEPLRRAIARTPPESLPDAFRVLYGVYARQRSKPLYGDKTPGYVRELPLLAGLFPEARFVHIVRDGRDVVLSLAELEWGRRGELEVLAQFWRRNVESAFAARDEIGPQRYFEVGYEHLVEDTERVLAGVCGFLEIDYEQGMLSYHERASEELPPQAHHTHIRQPPTKGLRDWRTQMPPEDVARFEAIAGESLARAGYRRST